MADEKILFKIIYDDSGNAVKLESTKKDFIDLDLTVKNANKSAKEINNTISKVGSGVTLKNLKLTRKEYDKLAKTQNQVKNSSGAASSAAMELGRVISDAPYGIRGMANNITQLVSQLGIATVKAGGFSAAMKQMWSALMGPLGIVLAITTVVSALDFFARGQKKAEEATNESTSSIDLQRKRLDELTESYNRYKKLKEEARFETAKESVELKSLIRQTVLGTNSQEEREKSLEKLIKLYPKYFKELNINDLKKIHKAERNINKELQRKIKVTNLINDAVKINRDIQLKEIELSKLSAMATEDKTIKQLVAEKKLSNEIVRLKSKEFELIESASFLRGLGADPSEKPEESKEVKGKTAKVTPLPTDKEFEVQAKSILSKTEAYNKKIELLSAKTAEEKLAVNLKYEGIALERDKKNEIDKLDDSFNKYKADLKNKEVAYAKSLKKNKDVSDEDARILLDSYKESNKKLIKIAEDKVGKEKGIVVTNYTELFELFDKLSLARVDALAGNEDEKVITLEKIGVFIDAYKELMGGVTDFLSGEFDRQLTMEQDKTNSLNKQLNDRLLNENLSKDERASIQNEIAKNDEKLRLKQDAINRKKFNQQKAFNIASATIDTYAGAAQVLADKKLPSWAKIPMMVSIIGSGLAQVAAISRQKFQSSSAATPINTTGGGGGAGATERAGPSFNIVGRSGDNLLINAIQAQFDKPLKAYVVSRDVTTQQQLDGMIVGQAGI